MRMLTLPKDDRTGNCYINGQTTEFRIELNPDACIPSNTLLTLDRGEANRPLGTIHVRDTQEAGKWRSRGILSVNQDTAGKDLLTYKCE